MEYRTAAIYHASTTLLEGVDRVQKGFLAEFGVDEVCAFEAFNLAPLCLRRDLAMLGLIHRSVLGQGPMQFKRFFFEEAVSDRRSGRFKRHQRQIHEWNTGKQFDIVSRSVLGHLVPSKNCGPEVCQAIPRAPASIC